MHRRAGLDQLALQPHSGNIRLPFSSMRPNHRRPSIAVPKEQTPGLLIEHNLSTDQRVRSSAT